MLTSIARIFCMAIVVSLMAGFVGCSSDKPTQHKPGDTVLVDTVRLRDYQYAEGRIYDLFYLSDSISRADRVIDMTVFESRPNARPEEELTARQALLVIDPARPDDVVFRDSLPMWELEPSLYNWLDDSAANRHFILFHSEHNYNALGVWMKVERRDVTGHVLDTVTLGDIASEPIILKMLRPTHGYGPAHPTWPLMWRNTYPVPLGSSPSELNIRIFKAPVGSEGTNSALEDQRTAMTSQGKYIRILGLDQYEQSGEKFCDDSVDNRIEVLRTDWGLLLFPSRKPFNSDTVFCDAWNRCTAPLEDRVPELYNYTSTKEMTDSSKYYIEYVYVRPQ